MSKVSVTGSKSILDEVIDALHELNRVHLTDYDGSWEAFDNGDPSEGADEASERLVTVRGLESTLDLDDEELPPERGFDPSTLGERLAEVRSSVNDLDDRRQELRQELRTVEERIGSMAPFARLGIDLDLLTGYDAIEVVVGEGDEDSIRSAYEASDDVRAVELFGGDGVVAAAVAPAEGVDMEDAAADPLVGVDFTRIEVPDSEGSPEDAVENLRTEKRRLEAEIESLNAELREQKLEVGGFLLAAEEYLTIQVQKGEAPLRFATTENSFVAEGWIPTAELETVEASIRDAVGDHVEFEELERAAYDRHGEVAHHDDVAEESGGDGVATAGASAGAETTADAAEESDEQVAADGGVVTVRDDPPTVQRNPEPTTPFEVLVQAVGRPNYGELDPTIVLFLTFPVFFGFMIGDVGYGVIYALIGLFAMRRFDSDAIQQFGVVVVWAGILTIAFGVFYGEIFGLHQLGEWIWGGHPPLRKGLSYGEWATGWLVVAVLAGWVHLTIGWALDFVDNYTLHGLTDAVLESGSWIAMLTGIWLWVFSTHLEGTKPELLFATFDGEPFAFGFAGFSPTVGFLGLGLLALGIALLIVGPVYELPEVAQPFAHTLSYTRLTAVLLSKAGMALVVNMLYFGAYQDEKGAYHYLIDHGPHYVETHEGAEMVFSGLYHTGLAGQIGGLLVLLIGHLVVLAIGVSAMIQAVRLEYVEFFGKFYEGSGKRFDPFGYDRDNTTED
ncbi:V-type ATP synthase subunit I [Salinarchaeum sp. Harcht-Bsk1]|uniref:V-type ATP synthase subunit I n=1 Tax=Salinarchaeum sp. Harcht-Bsk1 TaxID=1333523 RepID=UPI000AFCECAA|nr:V-type ATP synthase subunit I [Salinarchaeum sp. Harcht-Bsk1]